jgi:hypothetical protein
MSRAVILSEFREHILAPAGVTDWQHFQLRSLRPGGTTDLREADAPPSLVRKIGKWKTKIGMQPYDRTNKYIVKGLQPFREALVALQRR